MKDIIITHRALMCRLGSAGVHTHEDARTLSRIESLRIAPNRTKRTSNYRKILFRNGELSHLWPGVAARCRRGRGMDGQYGILADVDAW